MLDELKAIKTEIENAKTAKATAEGKIASMMERLKNDYGISSVNEAKKEMVSLNEKIVVLKKRLDEKFFELKTGMTDVQQS